MVGNTETKELDVDVGWVDKIGLVFLQAAGKFSVYFKYV